MTGQQQPTDGVSDEVLIGRNLAEARKRNGMSQTALAEHMRSKGFSAWRQTTVSRTERGTRQLIGGEVRQLEHLFGGDLWLGTSLGEVGRKASEAMRESYDDIARFQLGRLESALTEAADAAHKLRIVFDPGYEPTLGESEPTIAQLKGGK